jgi:hypothetical protein
MLVKSFERRAINNENANLMLFFDKMVKALET